jgi:hypothetical protein
LVIWGCLELPNYHITQSPIEVVHPLELILARD